MAWTGSIVKEEGEEENMSQQCKTQVSTAKGESFERAISSMAEEKSMPMILLGLEQGLWVKCWRSLRVLRPVPQPRSRMRSLTCSFSAMEEGAGLGLGICDRKEGRKVVSSISSMAWSMLPSESY